MRKFKFKTDFKYKLTIVAISLLIFIGILSYQFTSANFYIISSIIGILTLIAVIVSVLGFLKYIKELEKPVASKRLLLNIVISAFIAFLIYLILVNIFDAIQYLT